MSITYKPTRKGMMAAQLASSMVQGANLKEIASLLRNIGVEAQEQTLTLLRIEQLLRPADAAPLPTGDYRGGKPKKAPARSDKYRGCC